jgi:hypothetical protein
VNDGKKACVGCAKSPVEGEEKVVGKTNYTVDVTLPVVLWVKVLRGPIHMPISAAGCLGLRPNGDSKPTAYLFRHAWRGA